MTLALYRRYRPDTFEGVIGQDQVTVPLMRALDEHKLTHAYLFSGPRGCGKTSSARILARCINCVEGPTSHPCGVCDSCKDLATGGPGSIDVVEIDAASHNGVDDARELRERAGFAPARDRYKIFILDEAHMVTQQGFNALLKIVEEPPEHVMFIFATTEPERVIGTIRSRTHHYPFRLVPQEVMGPFLEHVCEQEEIKPQGGVLRLAMRAGGGSVRDTLSVIDQLMVGAVDGEISYDAAVALLGFTPDVLIGEAFDAIIDHDGAKLYEVIQHVVVGGFDSRRFVEDLLARARDLLVLTLAGSQAEHVLSDDDAQNIDELQTQAHALGLQQLTYIAQTLDDTLAQMVGAISPRMRLELLAARLLAGTQLAVEQTPHDARSVSVREQSTSTQLAHTQPASAPSSTPQETSSTPASVTSQSSVTKSPDELWHDVLQALPESVRQYVDSDRVPRVKLTDNPHGTGRRLWIKFDAPINKYAFALAVSNESSADGSKQVVNIVRAKVREIFGQDVALAPTQKMANGQEAPAYSRLPLQEQKRIKEQLLKLQLQSAAQSIGGDSESDETPVQLATSTTVTAPVLPEDDPWAMPVAVESHPHIDFARVERLEAQEQERSKSVSRETPQSTHVQMPHEQSHESTETQETVDDTADEYSLTDESLEQSQAMGFDEVAAMFDVKKTENFDAEDPRNPKNMQSHKNNNQD